MNFNQFYTYCFLILFIQIGASQTLDTLSFSEYLGYVKKYHPVVKQANLIISESEAQLMRARGGFDPKIEVNQDTKKFEGNNYYDQLNTTFKIPTWYGVEFKGSFEQNSGTYLNPELQNTTNGVYSAGIVFSPASGLLINKRMATLKQAKLYVKQAEADNQLLVNEILYQASKAYFIWIKAFKEQKLYKDVLQNAQDRLEGVKRSFDLGENPAIDITEAQIAVNNRALSLEKARLDFIEATLELSNFLWIEMVPAELKAEVVPETNLNQSINQFLNLNFLSIEQNLDNHPKLQSLDFKYKSLEVQRLLKRNNLLPKINLTYNFLNVNPEILGAFNTASYKSGFRLRFPLFLREERAELNLTNLQLESVNFDRQATCLELRNNLNSIKQQIKSYQKQIKISERIVDDFIQLFNGEQRKFDIGESSLFLVISRESQLLSSQLKLIDLDYKLLDAKGQLFNVSANQL
ncbi:MAG: TolC family protein [Flavobacteriaceae bacterium]